MNRVQIDGYRVDDPEPCEFCPFPGPRRFARHVMTETSLTGKVVRYLCSPCLEGEIMSWDQRVPLTADYTPAVKTQPSGYVLQSSYWPLGYRPTGP